MPLAMAMASSSSSNGTTTITGPKISSCTGFMLGLAAGEQRRRDVEAALHVPGPTAVDHDLAALVAAGGDVALDPVAVRRGDHRADDRVLVERVADLQRRRRIAASRSTTSS